MGQVLVEGSPGTHRLLSLAGMGRVRGGQRGWSGWDGQNLSLVGETVSYRAEELQETVLPILKLGTAPQPLRGLPAECLGQK